jgi:hypothetical protein
MSNNCNVKRAWPILFVAALGAYAYLQYTGKLGRQ